MILVALDGSRLFEKHISLAWPLVTGYLSASHTHGWPFLRASMAWQLRMFTMSDKNQDGKLDKNELMECSLAGRFLLSFLFSSAWQVWTVDAFMRDLQRWFCSSGDADSQNVHCRDEFWEVIFQGDLRSVERHLKPFRTPWKVKLPTFNPRLQAEWNSDEPDDFWAVRWYGRGLAEQESAMFNLKTSISLQASAFCRRTSISTRSNG